MPQLLDNLMWHSLAGPHIGFSAGTASARRFATGFSPIIGFANQAQPDFASLTPYCAPGEQFYCVGWTGPPSELGQLGPQWQINNEAAMTQMVWDGATPAHDEASDAIQLNATHIAQAMALAELTHPGPFGPRTIELGDYYGYFEHQQLIAMAGERMHAGTLREISGVCTHPEHQGRGYARRLMLKLIRQQMQRGETPVLHVMSGNLTACKLYEHMGFRIHRETTGRIVSRAV